MVEPRLIRGALAADDRGEVAFVNDFDFADVKRFYLVSNYLAGFVRAWHAHRREAKYVTVVQGTMLIACVLVDDWEKPSPTLPVQRFVLSAKTPAVLFIPAGYANGNMSLTADAKAIFFSTSSLEDSKGDDIRYDARLWDPWQVEER
jgi:dTDP-4-dehydrorhamnose 3,5-epimerase-like enzyme